MKIAHVVCQLPPSAGGIGMAAHSYADQLYERGYDVTVFTSSSSYDIKSDKRYKVKTITPWLRFGHGAFLPQLLWRLRSFDLVHLHYPFFGTNFIVALVKIIRRGRMKFVVTYHMDVNLAGWRKIYEIITRKYFLGYVLRTADKIIVSSDDYVENSHIQKFYFENIGKFVEIPFGVPRSYHPREKDGALLMKHGLSHEDKVIGFVGGLDTAHYFKGITYLIKAMSFIGDEKVKALIVGGGNLLDDYRELAEKLNLTDKIKFTGYVEKKLLPQYYNLFDVFVLPSINSSEAFGIVLIEAMACGKPVIASNLKGVRAVVDSGVNGLLVEPKNSRDIADKVRYVFDHHEISKKFGEQCLETVEKKYRWNVIIDKLEKVYDDLFKKQPAVGKEL